MFAVSLAENLFKMGNRRAAMPGIRDRSDGEGGMMAGKDNRVELESVQVKYVAASIIKCGDLLSLAGVGDFYEGETRIITMRVERADIQIGAGGFSPWRWPMPIRERSWTV